MSWEDQGRQYHSWFGHGTASEPPPTASADRLDITAQAIGSSAVMVLGGLLGKKLARMLAEGGQRDLAAALPIWVASADSSPERFSRLLVGPGFDAEKAALLQSMVQVLANAGPGQVSMREAMNAGALFAAALDLEHPSQWGYKLNYASDMATHALENEGVGSSQDQHLFGAGDAPIYLSAWSAKRQEWHDKCAAKYVGFGHRSDAPLLHLRCVNECMGS